MRIPEGNVTFTWVAPASQVGNLTINIKNSANQSVYTFNGSSNQVPNTLYTGENDCDGCQPPTGLTGEYQWTNEGFGTMLRWDYDVDPQSFKVYRSEDGVNYAEVATVDKTLREYFDIADMGAYYYKVTAYRSYCESTPAWTDNGEDYIYMEVTSVGENNQTCNVFPNPANACLCVESEGLQQVVICNMMGQVVFSQACDEDGLVISTSHFAQGIYTINLKTATGTSTRRFSVIH